MFKNKLLGPSILFAGMLGAANGLISIVPYLSLLSLVALVPFLLALNKWQQAKPNFLTRIFQVTSFCIGFFLFANYWLFSFGWSNGILLIGLNAILLTLLCWPIWAPQFTKGPYFMAVALTSGWMAFEVLHLHWAFAYPINGLGVNLLDWPVLTQWYEATGALGGSLWVLLSNSFIAVTIIKFKSKAVKKWTLLTTGMLVIPITISLLIDNFRAPKAAGEAQVSVVHPNLNCYEERANWSADSLTGYYASMVKDAAAEFPDSEIILLPENALTDAGWAYQLDAGEVPSQLINIAKALPASSEARIVLGACVYDQVPESKQEDVLATFSSELNLYYYVYNAALFVARDHAGFIRTKKELVPFEETVPLVEYFGGLLAGLGKRVGKFNYRFSHRKVRQEVYNHQEVNLLSLICYESLFGHSMAEKLRKNRTNMLSIHLNEGWYDDLWASRVFEKHSQARAIESRKFVARSSNRGYSSFIDNHGRILQKTGTKAAASIISQKLNLDKSVTLYVQLMSRIWPWLLFFLFTGVSTYTGYRLLHFKK